MHSLEYRKSQPTSCPAPGVEKFFLHILLKIWLDTNHVQVSIAVREERSEVIVRKTSCTNNVLPCPTLPRKKILVRSIVLTNVDSSGVTNHISCATVNSHIITIPFAVKLNWRIYVNYIEYILIKYSIFVHLERANGETVKNIP